MEIADSPPGGTRPPDDTGQPRNSAHPNRRPHNPNNNRSQRFQNSHQVDLNSPVNNTQNDGQVTHPQNGDVNQHRRRRPPRGGQGRAVPGRNQHTPGDAADETGTGNNQPPRPRQPRPPRKPRPASSADDLGTSSAHTQAGSTYTGNGTNTTPNEHSAPQPPRGNRRRKFGASLTDASAEGARRTSTTQKPSERYQKKNTVENGPPLADDLTSTLIHDLSTPPYPDCPICFVSIHPAQPSWSCSPSIPTLPPNTMESNSAFVPQYCWTTFHLKCIRSWAGKSVKEVSEAWRNRGEDRLGDWRCPGCQGKREAVPSGYWCFCNTTQDPKLTRLATPHSCGNPCARIRESGCGHPCPLPCHPGPCPPCQVTIRLQCYCPRKRIDAFKCGTERGKSKRDLSCGEPCGRLLNCRKHNCTKICHEGDCEPCCVVENVSCLCVKEKKDMLCGEGEAHLCEVKGPNGDVQKWTGRWTCSNICDRLYDCGIHRCDKSCHVPSFKPAICPLSPSLIKTCPCGSHRVAPSSKITPSISPEYTFPARENCTSPIPTCDSTCSKDLPFCDHVCQEKCHTGPCPPCFASVVRPCRCGQMTKSLPCFEFHSSVGEEREILCDKPCTVLRACGRHQCHRICCPLASLAAPLGKKGKKKAAPAPPGAEMGVGEERGGLHECDLVCGKMLSCGNHRCEEKDHKGPCPSCLRSSFEELACHCGRTIYEPPIPCGTKMHCPYPCSRPPPACGHPHTPHACHDDLTPCPPCVFLATKPCACGKKMVGNVKCSLERSKVSCGAACGKLMGCGFHHCERTCHLEDSDCGDCTAVCGKSRRLCLPAHHPCQQPCHAPASCPEDDPCTSLVQIACPCGRIKQSVNCGRCTSNPNAKGKEQTSSSSTLSLKCTPECGIAKRNAKLADALGITPENQVKVAEKLVAVSYPEHLVTFAKANGKFVGVVEKAFNDFINSDSKTHILPSMPPEKRKFVHDLAYGYRMDTQMVDPEPHRSVQLIRRFDTRIPHPLLSAYIASPSGTHTLSQGKPTPPAPSAASSSPSANIFAPKPLTGARTPGGWGSPLSRTPANPSTPASTSTTSSSTLRGWSAAAAGAPPAAVQSSLAPRTMVVLGSGGGNNGSSSGGGGNGDGGARSGLGGLSKPGSRPGSVAPSTITTSATTTTQTLGLSPGVAGVKAIATTTAAATVVAGASTGGDAAAQEEVDVPDDWEDDA